MKEAKARIKINKFLENARWRFFDSKEGKANIHLESNVLITEQSLNELGEDFEKTKNGFVDFLLLDEQGFNYDEVIKLPPSGGETGGVGGTTVVREYESVSPDPIKIISEIQIGLEGMKIDRKLFEKFEEVLKADEYVKYKIYEGKYDEAEAYIKREVFDKPEDYFDLDKLRKSVKVDRRLSLREILDKIFGKIKWFKSKDEFMEEEIQKFISIYQPQPKFVHIIGQFMKAYIIDESIRRVMESGEFSELATNPRFNMRDLKELDGWRKPVIEYIKDYVPMNAFV